MRALVSESRSKPASAYPPRSSEPIAWSVWMLISAGVADVDRGPDAAQPQPAPLPIGVHVVERDRAVDRLAVDHAPLARVAAVERDAGQQARDAREIEAQRHREVLGQGFRSGLAAASDPGRRGEALAVEAVQQVGLVAEESEPPVHADARFAPRRGHDHAVHARALDAQVGGRLVDLVDDPDRHQDQSGPDVRVVIEEEVEVRELDGDLSLVVRRRVLELDLGVEDDPVVELVAEVEHGPQEVDLVARLGRRAVVPAGVVVLVDHFAVAADRNAAGPGVDLRGRRRETGGPFRRRLVGRWFRRRRRLGLLPGAERLQFLGEDRELALQFLDLLPVRQLLRGRGRWCGRFLRNDRQTPRSQGERGRDEGVLEPVTEHRVSPSP